MLALSVHNDGYLKYGLWALHLISTGLFSFCCVCFLLINVITIQFKVHLSDIGTVSRFWPS